MVSITPPPIGIGLPNRNNPPLQRVPGPQPRVPTVCVSLVVYNTNTNIGPKFHFPVRTALDRLQTELDHVHGVVLFGSVARGQADRQSDIDLWVLADDWVQQHRAKELGQERFDGNRYEFQILVESPGSARGYGDRLEDVFAEAITLVDSDELRALKQEVLGNA